MSATLLDLLRARILVHGPMDLGEYMSLCLGHPQLGYYMTRDPFGVEGDFVTSPEISQMFGEMVGVWIADTWRRLGSPPQFALVECGPGRGTLMADALRATKHVPGLHEAMRIQLIEMSPILQEAQKKALEGYDPQWIDDVTRIKHGIPVIVVANEFLDALPIRQIRYDGSQWVEKMLAYGDNGMERVEMPAGDRLVDHVPVSIAFQKSREVFELSPVLNQFLKTLSEHIQTESGAALFIDYGHEVTAVGDTLQAVRKHAFVDLIDTPGTADITAHVDFENIVRIATSVGIFSTPVTTQASFLQNMGIEARADALRTRADARQKELIDSALDRLMGGDQMGRLFKAVAIYHNEDVRPVGFE